MRHALIVLAASLGASLLIQFSVTLGVFAQPDYFITWRQQDTLAGGAGGGDLDLLSFFWDYDVEPQVCGGSVVLYQASLRGARVTGERPGGTISVAMVRENDGTTGSPNYKDGVAVYCPGCSEPVEYLAEGFEGGLHVVIEFIDNPNPDPDAWVVFLNNDSVWLKSESEANFDGPVGGSSAQLGDLSFAAEGWWHNETATMLFTGVNWRRHSTGNFVPFEPTDTKSHRLHYPGETPAYWSGYALNDEAFAHIGELVEFTSSAATCS